MIRRSSLRRPGTFATDATASSADLPRELVAALQDPDALVSVDVVAVPDDRPVTVLAHVDPAAAALPPSVRAELERADTVVLQDAGARALAEQRSGDGPRTLVVATASLPRAPSSTDARSPAVDVVGLGAALAAAAASPSAGPLLLIDPDADVRAALRGAPTAARLVVVVPANALAATRALAGETRGSDACVVVQEYCRPVRLPHGADVDLPSSADVAVCFDAAPPGEALDPAVRAAVDALLADGVATRTTARALAALTGWDRRRAYDAVVAWRRA